MAGHSPHAAGRETVHLAAALGRVLAADAAARGECDLAGTDGEEDRP